MPKVPAIKELGGVWLASFLVIDVNLFCVLFP